MALAISGILIYGIGGVLNAQQKAYSLQEQILEMQEGLRIASILMNREIRMAGYDPTGTANAGIVFADTDRIEFTRDLSGDGSFDEDENGKMDKNEVITYSLYPPKYKNKLGRISGGGNNNPVLENVESIVFTYRTASGLELATPVADTGLIRNIEVTLTAKTAKADPKYPKNNGYRTRSLTTKINLRN